MISSRLRIFVCMKAAVCCFIWLGISGVAQAQTVANRKDTKSQSRDEPKSIIPYKNEVRKLASALVPERLQQTGETLILVIGSHGEVLKAEFVYEFEQDNSLRLLESKTKQIIAATVFPPLPQWYENKALPVWLPLESINTPFREVSIQPVKPAYRTEKSSTKSKQGNGFEGVDTREPIFDRTKLHGPDRFREYPARSPTVPPGAMLDAPLVPPGFRAGEKGGIQGGTPSLLKVNIEAGNIAPYRKELLRHLSKIIPEQLISDPCIFLLCIANDGTILKVEILEPTTKELQERSKRRLLKALEGTVFTPLPAWFTGRNLTFKINTATLQGIKDKSGRQPQ